jgi:hypothetical protein
MKKLVLGITLLLVLNTITLAGDLAVVTENVLGCTDKKSAQLGGMGLLAGNKGVLSQLLVGKDAKCLILKQKQKTVIKVLETKTFKVDDSLTQNFVQSRIIILNGENMEKKNMVMWSMYPYFKMKDKSIIGKIFYKKL